MSESTNHPTQKELSEAALQAKQGQSGILGENLLAGYLTHEELADQLDVSTRTIDRWRRLREAPPVTRVGKRLLYRRAAVEAWLASRETDSAAA